MAIDPNFRRGGGLGRGLEALFEDSRIDEAVAVQEKDNKAEGVEYLELSDLVPNSMQPRKKFDEERLKALEESIRDHGVLQPIIVRPKGSRYEIVAGERRWRASMGAGLERVPCIVRNLDDRENMLMALIENMQREDLDPIEEAEAFQEMTDAYGLTHAEISRTVGRSRPYITNSLRLLKLPEEVRGFVSEGTLSGGHARSLAGVKDEEKMISYARKCVAKNLSVRELEKMLRDSAKPKPLKKARAEFIVAEEKNLTESLGVKVGIKEGKNNKGKIELSFKNREEMETLIAMLKSIRS